MSSPSLNYALQNNFVANSKISASYLDRLTNIVDTQIAGSLDVLGPGVVQLPDATSLLCTKAAGLNISVAAGRLLALYSDNTHLVYLKLPNAQQVACPASTTGHIFAGIVVAGTAGDPDSEEGTALPHLFFSTNSSEPGALKLADVVAGASAITTCTDARTYARIDALQISVTALQAAVESLQEEVGEPYDEIALGTIKARLAALESGGGGGGGSGTVYWGLLARSFGDTTTIDQAIAAAIAAYATANPPGTGAALVVPETRDEIAVNDLNNAYLHLLAHDNAFDIAPLFRAIVVAPGRGHSFASDMASLIDYGNTTVVIDESASTFG